VAGRGAEQQQWDVPIGVAGLMELGKTQHVCFTDDTSRP
jgi:hypothetical protein